MECSIQDLFILNKILCTGKIVGSIWKQLVLEPTFLLHFCIFGWILTELNQLEFNSKALYWWRMDSKVLYWRRMQNENFLHFKYSTYHNKNSIQCTRHQVNIFYFLLHFCIFGWILTELNQLEFKTMSLE
jgi:hypothetical protein